MLLGMLMLIATGLFWAAIGIVMSRSCRGGSDFFTVSTISGALTTAAALMIFPEPESWKIEPSATLLQLALTMFGGAVLNYTGLFLVVRAMRSGHNGCVWMISQSAFVIPFAAGTFLFHEPLTVGRWVGIGLCLISIFLLSQLQGKDKAENVGEEAAKPAWLITALFAFLLLGMQQILTITPSYWSLAPELSGLRIPLFSAFATVVCAVIMIRGRAWPDKRAWWLGLALAVGGLLSLFFYFGGMDALAKEGRLSVGCPITVAACMFGFAAYSALHLREVFTRRSIFGMVLLLLSLIFFAVFP